MSIGQRFIQGYYDASYPPEVYGGGGTPAVAPTLTWIEPASGALISTPITLTITGTGFKPDVVVKAGGVALPTTFVSATSATATYTTPATAQTVLINVTNVADNKSSSALQFIVSATQEDMDALAGAQASKGGNGRKRQAAPAAPSVAETPTPPSTESER
jgi:IPT/TIG domain